MARLRIETAGSILSIQDLGRRGYQRFGVSPAGAMDPASSVLANLLVGNGPNAAVLELGPGLARFRAEGDLLIALAGPDCQLDVDGQRVATSTSVMVAEGKIIATKLGSSAVYAYLALAGGIDTPPEMGSRAHHRRSGIGGPALAMGMSLPVGTSGATEPMRLANGQASVGGPIRIMPGPQDDYFELAMIERLCSGDYRISALADRMGVRLDGAPLHHDKGYNIVSDGIVEGAIQVPGDGMPIVLLRDRQTTGGYPKIATIISADLGRFAQIPAGQPVRFAAVSLTEAVAAARELREKIAVLAARIEPIPTQLTSERLLSLNLVDGFVSAAC